MNFPKPDCDWSCNRTTGKWCEAHSRRMDFQVYINAKETIISHYRQIIMHEQSKEFHPSMADAIDMMISQSMGFIKKLIIQINQFHDKYKEDGVHGNKQT